MTTEQKIAKIEQATGEPVYVGPIIASGSDQIYACVDDNMFARRVMIPGETREAAVDALYARYVK